MVHHDQGGGIRLLVQGFIQPCQPFRAELPAVFARDHGVEANQSKRIVVVDGELQETFGRKIATVTESIAHLFPLVVIAGNGDDALAKRCQDRLQMGIFLRSTKTY